MTTFHFGVEYPFNDRIWVNYPFNNNNTFQIGPTLTDVLINKLLTAKVLAAEPENLPTHTRFQCDEAEILNCIKISSKSTRTSMFHLIHCWLNERKMLYLKCLTCPCSPSLWLCCLLLFLPEDPIPRSCPPPSDSDEMTWSQSRS